MARKMAALKMNFRWAKRTDVRFFPSLAALKSAVEASGGVAIFDPGAKFRPKKIPAHEIPPGESCKQWSQLEESLEWLASRNLDRSQTVLAIGGGACLDLAALTASLYRRGTPLILVPTTLLAMVDATLGGKTAVDRMSLGGRAKNFAGTFYPADEVWICPEFLATLTERERWSGAGEVWKTLWLDGKKDSASLRKFLDSGKIDAQFAQVLRHCLSVKKRFVEKDPLDQKRIRESLNFGHTVGHALESLSKGRISHGEAVWWGMAVEPLLLGESGRKMSELAARELQRIRSQAPKEFFLPEERWVEKFRADKKSNKNKIYLTTLAAPGKLRKIEVTREQLTKVVKDFPEFFRRVSRNPVK